MKYLKEFREYFSRLPAFSVGEAKLFLRKKGISKSYFTQLMHYLLFKGELKRISRGYYTFHSDAGVVGFAFRPFYYGLQDALSLRNLWEQEANPVVITIRRVRTGLRSFENCNYLVKHIDKQMFFGYEHIKYDEFWVPVSTIEKTLLDFIYFREFLPEEIFEILIKKSDKKILREFISRIPAKPRKRIMKRLGAKIVLKR